MEDDWVYGYQDGVSVGFINHTTITPGAQAVDLWIGNQESSGSRAVVGSVYQAALFCNRVLTATEHAQVASELESIQWPSITHSHGVVDVSADLDDSTLLADWSMRPVAGKAVDRSENGFDGIVNRAVFRASILGDALYFNGDNGTVDLTGLTSATEDHTVEMWLKGEDSTTTAQYFFDVETGRIILAWVGTSPGFMYIYDGAAWRIIEATPALNMYHHAVFVFDGTVNNVTTYLNGALFAETACAGRLYGGAAALGSYHGGTGVAFFKGLISSPSIYEDIKDLAWVQERYALGAQAVQFKTDFGFRDSLGDEGGTLDQGIGAPGSPIKTGDTVGRWAIETEEINGELCKVLVCKTAGIAYIPASYFLDTTSTDAAFGTWGFHLSKGASTTPRIDFIADTIGVTDSGNGYQFLVNSSEVVAVRELVSGVPTTKMDTAAGYVVPDTWLRVKLTRSSAGVFTTYIDGVVVDVSGGSGTNPFTDTTSTESSFIRLDLDAGDKICLGSLSGNYGITKQLGVVE